MNFKQLNESFDRLCEKALNEGPGAGYSFKGTAYINNVSNIKITKQEKTEKYGDLEVYFSADMDGVADVAFSSYEYYGELEDVRVAANAGYILIEAEELENVTDLEQYISSEMSKEEYEIDFTYGAGWSHVTYDGKLSTEQDSAESRYGDAQLMDLHMIYQEDIEYVDSVVTGDVNSDDYYESCKKEEKPVLKEEVTTDNAFDELMDMVDRYGSDTMIQELGRAIDSNELADCLNYIKRNFGEDDMDESLLTEKKWNVTIVSGSKLRDAIESGGLPRIISCLIDCYKELASKVDGIDRYAEEDIAELDSILEEYYSDEIDEEEAEEAVDYKLSGFYDLCDSVGAFVALNEKLEEARSNYGGKKGPFWYLTKHGLGPGMLPKDVQVIDTYEDDNMNTWVALDSILNTDELKEYELKEQTPPNKTENLKESVQHTYIDYEDVDEIKYPHLKEAFNCGAVSLIIYDNNMYNEHFDMELMKDYNLNPATVLKEIKSLSKELNVNFLLDGNYMD